MNHACRSSSLQRMETGIILDSSAGCSPKLTSGVKPDGDYYFVLEGGFYVTPTTSHRCRGRLLREVPINNRACCSSSLNLTRLSCGVWYYHYSSTNHVPANVCMRGQGFSVRAGHHYLILPWMIACLRGCKKLRADGYSHVLSFYRSLQLEPEIQR